MDRARITSATVLVAGALLLTACGTAAAPGTTGDATTPAPSPTASTEPSPTSLDVSSLVGTWAVSGPGIDADQKVSLEPFDARVWVPCGHATVSWRASTTGLFAAEMYGMSSECPDDLGVPWLEAAAGWRSDGPDVRLVDLEGQEVARLAPTTPPDDPAFAGVVHPDQASLTDQDRRDLNSSPSIGAGIARPATRALLVGSWVALRPSTQPPPEVPWEREQTPGLTLSEDGRWQGTDGCNGGGGRWNADSEGRILATLGMSTLLGCDNIEAPRWLGSAFLAGFTADGTLVLFDYRGTELGRLTRA